MIKFSGKGETQIRLYSPEEFREATGLIYLDKLEYENEGTYRRLQWQCADALRKGYIGQETRWLGVFHAEQIRTRYTAEVSVRWIDETLQLGLFAEADIPAGEYIGEYTGTVRRTGLLHRDINEYCFAYPTSARYFRKHVIDAGRKGNELRFINHSDAPNSESMGALCDGMLHVIFRATGDIPASTQITCDYSDFYWTARSRVPNLP